MQPSKHADFKTTKSAKLYLLSKCYIPICLVVCKEDLQTIPTTNRSQCASTGTKSSCCSTHCAESRRIHLSSAAAVGSRIQAPPRLRYSGVSPSVLLSLHGAQRPA